MKQRTLKAPVARKGVGLHSGVEAEVVLRPAGAGEGIVFMAGGRKVKAAATLVNPTPLCTMLDLGEGVRLSTVEHLMAALHALGVDNVRTEASGPEIPILDGSALPWVEALDEAGRVELEAERDWLKVAAAVEAREGLKALKAEPGREEGLWVRAGVDYLHPLIGSQTWEGMVDEDTFRHLIAPARTFVLQKDIEAAQAAGLARGGSLENAVVFGDDGTVLNPDGLRFDDEPVRHKVLDIVGDLYMAGRPVWGRVSVVLPGHAMNNLLLRKMTDNGA
jgi:UDP-3-O-[3-hydroxymyristoyl] N-acetylglucosamine deacetylase